MAVRQKHMYKSSIELDLSPFGAPLAGLHMLVHKPRSTITVKCTWKYYIAKYMAGGLQSHPGAVQPRAEAMEPAAAAIGPLATVAVLEAERWLGQQAQQQQLLVEHSSLAVHHLLQ